ncbi:MAG: DNA polymerase I [Sodalis sp. (in: enterobacteria)]
MVKVAEKSLILVDGSSYLYRAYHAFPPITNSVGEPTWAMYGVLNMLKSLLVQYRPSHFAVVFDVQGKTFRDELFKNYKSKRTPMPNDLRSQILPLHDMVKAMGLPLLAIGGVEADDVIGSLARVMEFAGNDVLISTSDKDMAQLVSSKITLINTMSNTILGPEEVKLKFGVPPELIIDYLALMGDSSDNIPGVPGIGKKTAQALLQGIGGLKRLYQQLDSVGNLCFRGAKNMGSKLEQYREIAFLSYQLATIKTDLALNVSYDQLLVAEPDVEALMLFFQRYEFKRWLRDLESGEWLQGSKNVIFPKFPLSAPGKEVFQRPQEISSKNGYRIINDMASLEIWITEIKHAGVFAFDTETDGPDTLTANLLGLCFSVKPGEVVYLPVSYDFFNAPDKFDRMDVLAVLKPVLQDPEIAKIGQNLKFNCGILKRYNIDLNGVYFDTMLESYVLNSIVSFHNKDSLLERLLQHTTVGFKETEDRDHKQMIFNQRLTDKGAHYSTEDTDANLRLHQKLWPYIEIVPELKKVFEEIEMPLIPVLSRIERTGVLIDESILTGYSVELTKRLEKLDQEARQLAEEPLNLSSTKQLQTILYDKQKLPVLKKTPCGAPSTNKEVLSALALDYPLPKLILEYRSLAKLKSSYTDKLPKMINPISKRLHTSYHQANTVTGRLSSSNPNLQNIPVRNDESRRIRQAFIAPLNALIVAADYSQIELRIMAHLARDRELLNAFAVGKDIHCATAADVFCISIENVTQEQRQSAKAINFGLIYGMTAFGLARQLSVSRSEAQKYINLYFKRYPGVLEYMERTCRQASIQGYVSTMDGRRLYLPDIHSCNGMRKRGAKRAAINAPLQGTAADIIKRAMITIDHWLQKEKPPVRMIMQVHDELVFEVRCDVIEDSTVRIKELMEGCFALDVPLKVDVGVGKNWDQAH